MFANFWKKHPLQLMMLVVLLLTITVFPYIQAYQQYDCNRSTYDRCVRIADPLIKEPHLVFPDNIDDINLVCRTWDDFVNCLKQYIDNCFTIEQRKQFNKAVENPIESVHKMCMLPTYQQEYLQYAPCIKNTITQQIHCGQHYNLLVEQVSQGDIISKSTLCCSYDRFKRCISRETRRLCDRGYNNGPAQKFSNQIINKALSFLQEQCYNYNPLSNNGDCLSADNTRVNDQLTSSENYPYWSTVQDLQPKEVQSKMAVTTTTTTWLPTSSQPVQQSTQSLGTRTRPVSYGRSYSWSNVPSSSVSPPPSSSSSSSLSTTSEIYYPSSTTTQSTINDWSTVMNWQSKSIDNTYGSTVRQESTGDVDGSFNNPRTTWYPAAGDQLVNEVDEPNQQGLTKLKNHCNYLKSSILLQLLLIISFYLFK